MTNSATNVDLDKAQWIPDQEILKSLQPSKKKLKIFLFQSIFSVFLSII